MAHHDESWAIFWVYWKVGSGAKARDKVAKKTYIRATAYSSAIFEKHFQTLKSDPSWRTYAGA
jgi:hypothetical protein